MSEVVHRPVYWRVLGLRWIRPNALVRVLLVEGLLFVALLLCLAGVASPWSFLVLPAVGAVVAKANDVIAGQLVRTRDTKTTDSP